MRLLSHFMRMAKQYRASRSSTRNAHDPADLILLTGASGYVGGRLRRLLERVDRGEIGLF